MKVGTKIFAILSEDAEPLTVSLKCEPEVAVILRTAHEAVQPGYHLNKRHWNTVTLDGSITRREVFEWVDDSYDLVRESLPRKVQRTIGSDAR